MSKSERRVEGLSADGSPLTESKLGYSKLVQQVFVPETLGQMPQGLSRVP